MKWIGQQIYDQVSRFRDDVYLENIVTGTIVSGGHLGLDSNNKIVKAADGGGDLTSIVAGTGLSGTDLTGPIPTLNVDASQLGVTRVGTLENLRVTSSSFLGVPTMVLTNADVDQIALDINASNTTANVVDIDADSLTTGSALNIDVDDALTTSATKSLAVIDYDKAGVTAAGQTSLTHGLSINMADAATNNAAGTVSMIGAQIDIDSANAQGVINQRGIVINVAADGVGDAALVGAPTGVAAVVGLDITCMDGGNDILLKSHAEERDFSAIATTTNGATTITTVDYDGALAHFSIEADGDIRLKPATGILRFMDSDNAADYTSLEVGLHGDIKLTTRDIAAAAAHFEIEADGDITLDSAGQIKLEPVAGNNILLDGTVAIDGGSVTGITTLGVDSVSLTAVQTSAESFVDNDTSLMTSAAIDDKINTKYSTSYIPFSAKSTSSHGTNYVMINALGISQAAFTVDSSVDSAGDFGGVTTEEGGSGTDATAAVVSSNLEQQIVIPETCKLIGFYATTSSYNTGSGTTDAYDTGVAIWHVPESGVNWGSSTDSTATLIHKSDSSRHGENESHGGDNRKKVQMVKRMDGTAKTLGEGDIIIPSIFGETSNQQIFATITLVLAVPIKTIA